MTRFPLAIAAALLLSLPALARDNGQWDAIDPEVGAWFQNLKQPDNPRASCCGEADAYYADSFAVENGQTIAIVTDTRDDAPLQRPHIKPGTRIMVPNAKLKFDDGNPTGHGVIFVKWIADGGEDDAGWQVLCYVTPGGV